MKPTSIIVRCLVSILTVFLACEFATANTRSHSVGENEVNVSFKIDSITWINHTDPLNAGLKMQIPGFTEVLGKGYPAIVRRVETFEIPRDCGISNIEITSVCDTINAQLASAEDLSQFTMREMIV